MFIYENDYNRCHRNGRKLRGRHLKIMYLSIDAMIQLQLPMFGENHTPNFNFFQHKLGVTPMGIYNEGSKRDIIYFYDQKFGCTKSTHVISLIDRYIKKNRNRETTFILNFDNCKVNKNFLVSNDEDQ